MFSDIWCFGKYLSYLAENNQGLAGWVGAGGSILAVGAAWAISRHEYLRTVRRDNDRKREKIELIENALADFEKGIIDTLRDAKPNDSVYLARCWNGPLHASIKDLDGVPVTDWPSLESYVLFKRYYRCLQSMEPILDGMAQDIPRRLPDRLQEHDAIVVELKAALKRARP